MLLTLRAMAFVQNPRDAGLGLGLGIGSLKKEGRGSSQKFCASAPP